MAALKAMTLVDKKAAYLVAYLVAWSEHQRVDSLVARKDCSLVALLDDLRVVVMVDQLVVH